MRSFSSFQNRSASAFVLKTKHDVVSKPHHEHVAACDLPLPGLGPQVEDVVKVDVGQQWRCTATLGRPRFTHRQLPLFQHARSQPFLDETYDAPVPNPVLHEFHQPLLRQRVEKVSDVKVEHPVHLLPYVSLDRAGPAHCAGFAPAGIHTRNPQSPPRRSHSTPPRPPVGPACPPAPSLRAVAAARRSWVCTSYALALPDTLLAAAWRRGPGGSPRGPLSSAATSRHPHQARLLSSVGRRPTPAFPGHRRSGTAR